MNYKTFETERLILIPTHENDAEFVFELLNSPKWIQFIGDRGIRSVEDAKDYINTRMKPQLERLGFSNYTIHRKEDGAKLGSCGLYNREGIDGIDIGFAFLPQFEKKGYAYEATQKLMKEAKDSFELKSVCGYTTVNNYSSQKLLEKLGLKNEGTIQLPDDDEVLILYKIDL